ncbi:uncharacterized protein PV07_12362 [Cladophialophora immunda]|uniref:Nephrocystin 3-like N-terminal domain-containing protein n=1 Tax=Cladophialophora immunda TaxID=569365 RepID=A0A0D2BTY0_9EURO|nr:uncharacterized protein PV07_12362 [Cladophialophora immunda]KIW22478.1 hypothetical protein PV07_12362 [Cladophialophora immunda]
MLQRLARQLALFDLYARLYPHSTRLRESLVEGYDAYLEFCLSVVKMLEGGSSRKNRCIGSLKLMTKTLFKSVKQDFGRVISRLESLVDSIETEANAAEKEAAADHREVVNEQIDCMLSAFQKDTEWIYSVFLTVKKYQDLLQWLDPVDTAAVLLDLSDIHLPGTGQWLIGNEACIKWFTNPSSILCVSTVFGAYNLIKHLQQHVTDKSIVLYYFSDYRSVKSQQTRTVIQTLLADLGRQSNQVLEILEASTRRYRKENLACSLQVVTEILIQCLALYQEVHVVIDALDESGNRPELIQLLLSLQSKSQATNLFLTSRDEYDIRDMLGHVEQISVDSSDMTSDIDHFIQHTVKELINNGRLKLRDKTLRETIAQRLGDEADGMFQYVKCQLDTLSQCISDRAIIIMLENLPSSLDQTYVRALERLKTTFPDTIGLITWIFCCIVHSTRPLSLAELSQPVSFDVKRGMFDCTAVPTDPHDLFRYSGGLFRFSDAKGTLSLVHFSVKEFLQSERICETSARDFYMGGDTAHLHMFRACLSYLL